MQVDRRAQRRGAFPERIIGPVIEIFSVGVTVDHGAAKLQVADAAFEFLGCGFDILHGKVGEAGIAVRALAHFRGEEIVRCPRGTNGGRGVALDLHAGPGDRQHGARDAGLVHHLQPLVAEVAEAGVKLRRLGRCDIDHGRPPIRLGRGIQKVLFQGNLLDHGVCS